MKHPHGTDNAYTADKCRCTPCRQAHNKAARDRRRQQAYGRYTKTKRPAQTAINHINTLRAQGITLKQIHTATGVAMITLSEITLSKRPIIQAATETRILNYNPGPEHASPHATTNTPGTARRLQALQYNGWDQDTLALKLGLQRSHVWKLTHQRTGATTPIAQRVKTLYDQLWNQYPEPGKSSNLARTIARRNGWLPPLAWDEERLDDPNHHGYPKDIAA
jgi:transcriptional regulator with XRE-family HTH domain